MHFAVKRSEKFGKYDRGPKENLERYGQEEPPLYQLAKFPSESFPQLFFTGGIDQLADPSDTKRLLQELPTSGVREVINLPEYGHGDFVLAQRANIDVYSKIVSFFKSN